MTSWARMNLVVSYSERWPLEKCFLTTDLLQRGEPVSDGNERLEHGQLLLDHERCSCGLSHGSLPGEPYWRPCCQTRPIVEDVKTQIRWPSWKEGASGGEGCRIGVVLLYEERCIVDAGARCARWDIFGLSVLGKGILRRRTE